MNATVTSINKFRKIPFAKIGAGVVEQPALPFVETKESLVTNVHAVVKRAAFISSDPEHVAEISALQSFLPNLNISEAGELLLRLVNETLEGCDDYCRVTINRAVDKYLTVCNESEN